MTAHLTLNPLQILIDTFNTISGGRHVPITFKPSDAMPTPDSTPLNDDDGRPDGTGSVPAAGVTIFAKDGTVEIWLNAAVPMEDLPAVLGEELAHVLAGPSAQHGPLFQQEHEELSAKFQANLEWYARSSGTSAVPAHVRAALKRLTGNGRPKPFQVITVDDLDDLINRQETARRLGSSAEHLLTQLSARTAEPLPFWATAAGQFLANLVHASDHAAGELESAIHVTALDISANALTDERRRALQQAPRPAEISTFCFPQFQSSESLLISAPPQGDPS